MPRTASVDTRPFAGHERRALIPPRAWVAPYVHAQSKGEDMKAIWNGEVLAESHETKVVEGNHYFPRESIRPEFFSESSRTSVCPWKGLASYFDLVVGDARNEGAAWYYPEPKPAASEIAGHVAFWKGVQVVE